MKFINNKSITNKIIILLIFAIIINFTVPNYSFAAIDGGLLFKPLFQFVCGIGDLIIMTLQKVFLGVATISDGNINISERQYLIYYSPYNIFSGSIPILDINFVHPEEKNNQLVTSKVGPSIQSITDALEMQNGAQEIENKVYGGNGILTLFITKKGCIKSFKENYGYDEELDITEEKETIFSDINTIFGGNDVSYQEIEAVWYSEEDNSVYVIVNSEETKSSSFVDSAGVAQTTTKNEQRIILYKLKCRENLDSARDAVGEVETKTTTVNVTKKSSAVVLQSVIATWYNILKTIALVGLMSVLLYLGIRMLLSSVGEDKAKYKKMFTDWLVAICILFALHYMMIIIIEITNSLVSILVSSNENTLLEADELMGTIRESVAADPSFKTSLGNLLMYLALVLYTCKFTFVYLKRVIIMAFLTVIAPLIALTYPLDKVKDGNAQAFSIWLKEYIFNALLQVLHLLLYIVLVKSAMELVQEVWLYGIVAIGFLIPAENLFRKMFGFDQAGTLSAVKAFAGGAVFTQLMNKMKSSAQKSANSPTGTNNPANTKRTAGGPNNMSNSTEAWAKDSAEGKVGEKAGEVTGKGTGELVGGLGGAVVGSVVPGVGTAAGAKTGAKAVGDIGKTTGGALGKGIGNAMGSARRKAIKRVKAMAKKKFTKKKIAKAIGKKALQIGAGATLGTIGLAAGIATGDLSNVAKFGMGGIAAGGAIGAGLTDSIESKIKNASDNIETFKEGYLGTEYEQYLNKKLDKEFMNNPEVLSHYMTNFENYEQAMNDALIARQNGITDNEEITKILNMAYGENPNATQEERILNIQRMVNVAQINKHITDDQYSDPKAREEFQKSIAKKLQEQNVSKQEAQENAKKIMELLGKFKNNEF